MPPVVKRELFATSREGIEFSIVLSLGKPYETEHSDWACPVALSGLHENLRDIHGVDAWQSLQLAYRLAISLLTTFEEEGGQLYWLESREPIEAKELLP